jgi:hypothetical protein
VTPIEGAKLYSAGLITGGVNAVEASFWLVVRGRSQPRFIGVFQPFALGTLANRSLHHRSS